MYKPIIACDIDGVIADQIPVFLEIIERLYSVRKSYNDIIDYSFAKSLDLPGNSDKEIIEEYNRVGLLNVQPFPNSIKYINELNTKFGIAILTSRTNKATTIKWLDDWNVLHSKIDFISNSNKGQYCIDNDIPYLIEDCGEVCVSAAQKGIQCLLYNAPWNTNFSHENIYRCMDWGSIYSYLLRILTKEEEQYAK